MANGEGNPGMNKLARAISNRVRKVGDDITGNLILDFGVINDDMSLQTNTFPIPIPKGQYRVCRQLTLGPTDNILAKTQTMGMPHSGAHIHSTMSLTCSSHGGTVSGTVGTSTGAAPDPPIPSVRTAGGDTMDGVHQHHVLIPELMRSIKPGDHVLVGWVQDDPVVIDIILSSDRL